MFGDGAPVYDRARPGWWARLRRAWRCALAVLDPAVVIAVIAKHAVPDDDRLVAELEAERLENTKSKRDKPESDRPNGES